MTKKVYISGPMTGHKDFNAARFDLTEGMLAAQNCEVINPLQKERDSGVNFYGRTGKESLSEMGIDLTMNQIITQDVELLLTCDVIYMLPGWRSSKGATAEYYVALWAGIDIWGNVTHRYSEQTCQSLQSS